MRLFIAASFPAAILAELEDRVQKLRPRLPSASWVKPEARHVTFAFLGEQPESVIGTVEKNVNAAIGDVSSFQAKLRGCGVFPNARQARVGWIGLEPEQPFVELASNVRKAVKESGIELDAADFKPHLTLMRIRDRWPPASIDLFRKSLADYESSAFRVEALTLFSSKLDPTGAIHTPVRELALRS
jgi:2'-5' RNA ligase